MPLSVQAEFVLFLQFFCSDELPCVVYAKIKRVSQLFLENPQWLWWLLKVIT